MKPEIKTLWLAALRSGQYDQGTHALRTLGEHKAGQHAYCCLGVLCNVFHEVTGKGHWDTDNTFVVSDEDQNDQVLPQGVMEWAGLADVNPDIGGGEDNLAGKNDSGTPFSEIADIIEAEL